MVPRRTGLRRQRQGAAAIRRRAQDTQAVVGAEAKCEGRRGRPGALFHWAPFCAAHRRSKPSAAAEQRREHPAVRRIARFAADLPSGVTVASRKTVMPVDPQLRSLNIDVPAQPESLVKLSLLLADENVNLQSVSALIAGDMALASAVLKAVNSSMYGKAGC